ncbi:unnamed protein product [Closterium sp. Yama58-4]|nr:unnamed protein product [Closterium sp. Yama58-4]
MRGDNDGVGGPSEHQGAVLAMEMRLRALEGQLEETRRGLEEAERRRAEEMLTVKGEMLTVREELVAVKGELVTRRGELATARGELTTVKGELVTVRGELVTVRGELMTVKGEVEALKGGLVEVKMESAKQKECLQKVEEERLGMEGEVKRRRKGESSDEAAVVQCSASRHFDTTLDLKGLSGLSDTFLRHVATMTHLKHVHIDGCSGFTSEGLKCLYSLPLLERLELKSSVVTDSTLDGIGRVRTLKFLYLNRTKVTDSGLVHLKCL